MKAQHFEIFTEKQIEVIKLIVKTGCWGDTDIKFGNNTAENYAFGFFTNNTGGGKQVSGVCSGISKTIKDTNTEALAMISDWWQDGSGDMMFINMDLLECDYDELKKWAEN